MEEIYLDSVASQQVFTYSANKRIEEKFKLKEKKLLRQQRQANSRILRQETKLFDDLLQMHVRTPSCIEGFGKEELFEVGDVKLNPVLFSKVAPRKPGQKRTTSNIVSPVLKVVGGSVFCSMLKGENFERELETRPRTRLLLTKSDSICKCLNTLAEKSSLKNKCDKCMSGTANQLKPFQRAHTFYDARTKNLVTSATERRVTTANCKQFTQTLQITPKPRVGHATSNGVSAGSTDYKSICTKSKSHQRSTENSDTSRLSETCDEFSSSTKMSNFSHLVYFNLNSRRREKQRRDCEEEHKRKEKVKYLSKTIESLKRAAGIDVKKRMMFVNSVHISSVACHHKTLQQHRRIDSSRKQR